MITVLQNLLQLVSLARADENVSRLAQLCRAADPVLAADDGFVTIRFFADAFYDRIDDRLRLLACRIIGGNDDKVRVCSGSPAHHRAFGLVPVSVGAEHDDEED